MLNHEKGFCLNLEVDRYTKVPLHPMAHTLHKTWESLCDGLGGQSRAQEKQRGGCSMLKTVSSPNWVMQVSNLCSSMGCVRDGVCDNELFKSAKSLKPSPNGEARAKGNA